MDKRIFVHIPKNGGMTIRDKRSLIHQHIITSAKHNLYPDYCRKLEQTMREFPTAGYQHARWIDFRKELTTKYRAFAIVRNPWSRVVSRYTFGTKTFSTHKGRTFEQFLEERYKDGNLPFFWHRAIRGWNPQKDYVVNKNGKLVCDILRFEYYNEDVMKYFNLKEPLYVRNVSNGNKNKRKSKTEVENKKDYREFYTDETKQIIAEWYKDDIELFGFTFDGAAIKNIWSR